MRYNVVKYVVSRNGIRRIRTNGIIELQVERVRRHPAGCQIMNSEFFKNNYLQRNREIIIDLFYVWLKQIYIVINKHDPNFRSYSKYQ